MKREDLPNAALWTVREIAGYWRLQRDGYLVATFNSKGAALAGMAVEKRRAKNNAAQQVDGTASAQARKSTTPAAAAPRFRRSCVLCGVDTKDLEEHECSLEDLQKNAAQLRDGTI